MWVTCAALIVLIEFDDYAFVTGGAEEVGRRSCITNPMTPNASPRTMEKSTFTPHYDALRARLVALRKAAGLTQRQLAARLGREPSFVARLEQGERRLDVVELAWLCKACGSDPNQVIAGLLREFAEIDRSKKRKRRGPARPR